MGVLSPSNHDTARTLEPLAKKPAAAPVDTPAKTPAEAPAESALEPPAPTQALAQPTPPKPPAPAGKNDDELLCFGRLDGKAVPEGQSLQDAFKRFRGERKRQQTRVPASKLKVLAAARRARDPAGDKRWLRRKFIEHAKTYVGIPYAERYHKPGDPLYGRPLYLDCCNFIRRVVQDMRADFGFDLGMWNQAYQFATLPDARAFEELEPGDLMFVEATYRTGQHRQQKMNIVHVEIYLGAEFGTGPESNLGSRNRWGCVEILDSYEYASSFYEITNVFWRKLDPWLEGRCDPWTMRDLFASHDPYGAKATRLSAKSVFGADDDAAAVGDAAAAAPPAMTVVDVLKEAGAVSCVGAFAGFRSVGRLHAASRALGNVLESDGTAPALWHGACVALGAERGLVVPATPVPAPGSDARGRSAAAAMAWKRLFFNQLWPARDKWALADAGGANAPRRDFKIEVCVRFRPEAEGDAGDGAAASADVTLPLHQFLRVQRQRRDETASDAPLVGGERPPACLLDAVTGAELKSPVRLPGGAVVDRSWAEAHVARRGTDPYDGGPAPPLPLPSAADVKEQLVAFRARRDAADASTGVAGSEVVRRLAGAKALDPTVLDAVLEAERLAASATAAEEAAARKAQRGALAADDDDDDAESDAAAARDDDAPAPAASAADLTQGLESAEAEVRKIEEKQDGGDDAPRPARSGCKVLAVQPTRVVVHVPGAGVKPFPFSRVFESEGQADVYAAVGAPAVTSALNGMNACVLCYGQTGSGKTYAAFGPPGALERDLGDLTDDAASGLVVRALRDLLRGQGADEALTVGLQYVEIYNERCVDLLTGNACDVSRSTGEPVGCVEADVATFADGARLLRAGNVRKRFAATAMNARSSRAHSVVVLKLKQTRRGALLESRLMLADLAGSERIYRSGAAHDAARRAEAVNINGSLLVLGKVVAALVEGQAHVPYLEAKLATLLKSALGGASRTTALVCCRRRADHADETLQALRFGKRCALVSNLAERVAASSAADALATIDATIASCEKALDDLRGRGNAGLAKTLDDRLKQMKTRRRAITDIVRAEARARDAGAP